MQKNSDGLYEVKIDGMGFEFQKWGADESLDVLLDLAKIVGEPLGRAAGSFLKDGAIDQEFDPNMLGLVFDSLTTKMDKRLVKDLIKKMASEKILCDGKKVEFNSFYQDKLALSFKVVKACLEVQYGNFFDAIADLLPSVKKVSLVQKAT